MQVVLLRIHILQLWKIVECMLTYKNLRYRFLKFVRGILLLFMVAQFYMGIRILNILILVSQNRLFCERFPS